MTASRRYLAALLRRQHGRHRAPQVIVPPRMPCRHGLFGCDHCRPTYRTGIAVRSALMTPTRAYPMVPGAPLFQPEQGGRLPRHPVFGRHGGAR